MSEKASWRDNVPDWMRGTVPHMTEAELAEFDRRATERMIEAEEFEHRMMSAPVSAQENTGTLPAPPPPVCEPPTIAKELLDDFPD